MRVQTPKKVNIDRAFGKTDFPSRPELTDYYTVLFVSYSFLVSFAEHLTILVKLFIEI